MMDINKIEEELFLLEQEEGQNRIDFEEKEITKDKKYISDTQKASNKRRQIRYRAKKQEMKKLERNLTGLSLQNTRRRVSVVSKIGILIVEKEEKD
jgi:hypothetical protein